MRPAILLFLSLSVVACSKAETSHAGPTAVNVEAAKPAGKESSKALLEIHAQIDVDVSSAKESSDLAAALDAHAREHGGFVEHSSEGTDGARLGLRVPANDLPSVRALLGGHGVVAHESLQAKDVTEAIADVDARVGAAKLEEKRLLLLLEKQTGTLADVLAVEKVIADVRERIERLEAEQRSAHGRVDLATIEVNLRIRGALAEAPFGHRLAVAGREGVAFARESAIIATTTLVRVAPTLGPLGLACFFLARLGRKKKAA